MPSIIHRNSCTRSNSSSYFSSPSPSPSPPPTIHHRRTLSRNNSSNTPPPPALSTLGLPVSPFSNSASSTSTSTAAPAFVPQKGESDAECWNRMLALQREYHCYNSARLEAAVEALEKGYKIEEVPIPSRFCLDLLNEELQAQIEASSTQ